MNYLNGGYVMLDKADSNIYAKALGALNAGKPILWYEDKNTCYYIDTLAKSGDDIVLTKGGKTITITDANVVTESGEIQNHLYEHRITINGQDTNDDEYYIRIVLYNNSDTLLTIQDVAKQKFNGVGTITGSNYVSQAIDGFNLDENEINEIYSTFDGESIAVTRIATYDFVDEVTQIF